MILSTDQNPARLGMKLLLVHKEAGHDSIAGRLVDKLARQLDNYDVAVLTADSARDGSLMLASDTEIQALLLDWDMDDAVSHQSAIDVINALRRHNDKMPLFIFTNRENAAQIPAPVLADVDDFIWLFEDTADFIAGRILAALRRYRAQLLPPMFNALCKYAQVHEYSWHTPGHTGGTAFLKSTVGRAYFDYFGENLLRSDLSISVGELGSLLDHSGPIGEGEDYAARVFGADYTFCVTNGSSMSNRVILMASVARGQIAYLDRNCHKSLEHGITMSGAIPTYMMPTRNYYGIIGPIPASRMTKEALAKSLGENPLTKEATDPKPVHAVVTNSTYDGLCYNIERVEELLGQSVDRIHFDEAWYGYARFNPIYAKRYGMHGDPAKRGKNAPTIFATQSTHKLLAALSQASMIHIREGRNPIGKHRFNETYMMHASTSPNYAIIASNDVSAGMMAGPGGKALTDESIHEAVAFRRLLARIHAEMTEKGEWFFNAWQPDEVPAKQGGMVPFYKADEEWLATNPECWVLKPNAAWHGFGDLEDGYCMLDPIKVTVTTPGMNREGKLEKTGIPASVLSSYLDANGIVVEKTQDFTILFLFSIGITKGKWGTLINALLRFKQDYDVNAPLKEVLPALVARAPKRYGHMGLKDLCTEMFGAMGKFGTTRYLSEAFSILPKPDMTPSKAYELLVRNEIDRVNLEQCANRTLATGIVPYPPGIPLLMPGENAGPADGPLLGYLKALEAFDRQFPGFEHDSHGVESVDGEYMVSVIKK